MLASTPELEDVVPALAGFTSRTQLLVASCYGAAMHRWLLAGVQYRSMPRLGWGVSNTPRSDLALRRTGGRFKYNQFITVSVDRRGGIEDATLLMMNDYILSIYYVTT